MFGKRMFTAAVIAAAMIATPALAGKGNALSGPQIEQTVKGKRVLLQVPFGGEMPLTYRSNGTVIGDGARVRFQAVTPPQDQGRWWIAGNKICLKWSNWYRGKQRCYGVSKGAGAVIYISGHGMTGTAYVSR